MHSKAFVFASSKFAFWIICSISAANQFRCRDAKRWKVYTISAAPKAGSVARIWTQQQSVKFLFRVKSNARWKWNFFCFGKSFAKAGVEWNIWLKIGERVPFLKKSRICSFIIFDSFVYATCVVWMLEFQQCLSSPSAQWIGNMKILKTSNREIKLLSMFGVGKMVTDISFWCSLFNFCLLQWVTYLHWRRKNINDNIVFNREVGIHTAAKIMENVK